MPFLESTEMTHAPRIAVLVSGRGSNLQALLDAEARGELGCSIAVVISDVPDAGGLDRAKDAGTPSRVVRWSDHANRDSFTTAICDVADEFSVDGLVLAGFMRILAPEAIDRFPNRIINIHPSLLPSFPGAHAVPQALAYGVALTGVTVHFVDREVDHGPIIAQESVTVEAGDDEATLHRRIQEVEHRLLPEVVAAFAAGELDVDGRNVVWKRGGGAS